MPASDFATNHPDVYKAALTVVTVLPAGTVHSARDVAQIIGQLSAAAGAPQPSAKLVGSAMRAVGAQPTRTSDTRGYYWTAEPVTDAACGDGSSGARGGLVPVVGDVSAGVSVPASPSVDPSQCAHTRAYIPHEGSTCKNPTSVTPQGSGHGAATHTLTDLDQLANELADLLGYDRIRRLSSRHEIFLASERRFLAATRGKRSDGGEQLRSNPAVTLNEVRFEHAARALAYAATLTW